MEITKAMQVVAATRLRRAQQAVRRRGPTPRRWSRCCRRLRSARGVRHPFLVRREGRRGVMVLITTDKGLCGAINVNNIRAGTRFMTRTTPKGQRYVTSGAKAATFSCAIAGGGRGGERRRDRPTMAQILPRSTVALEEYTKGNTDAVILCYSKWILDHAPGPDCADAHPADSKACGGEAQSGPRADYIYEPDPDPSWTACFRYVETQIFQAVLENKASE